MIDLELVRKDPAFYQTVCKNKNIKLDVKAFLTLDESRRAMMSKVQTMQAERNSVSKKVPTLKGAEKETVIKEMKEPSETLKAAEAELAGVDKEWMAMQLQLPSAPLAAVPVGKDDSENVEKRTWGTVPTFSFEPKDHTALGASLDIIDIPRGV